MNFRIAGQTVDSVELKCLVVSRGLKIDREVYQVCGKTHRIYPNALTCNSFRLPDGTVVMATDLGFHLSTLSSMFSWDNLKLFRYMSDMTTDYRLSLIDGQPMLTYIAERYGPGKAFCNFIIGLEPFETLREGAAYLAERGVIPSASVWMPFGKPVNGSMKPASLDYFRRTKEMLSELYMKYGLEPAGCCGLNVCVERDIWRAAAGTPCC